MLLAIGDAVAAPSVGSAMVIASAVSGGGRSAAVGSREARGAGCGASCDGTQLAPCYHGGGGIPGAGGHPDTCPNCHAYPGADHYSNGNVDCYPDPEAGTHSDTHSGVS